MTAQFQLVMRQGPVPGATFSLEGDQLIIGRDSSSGVAINDAEVSRKHARLSFQGGKYVLEDLGSTNGTFVNGQRLASPAVLKSGDVISLGEQIVLMYEALSSDPGATVMTSRKNAPPHPVAAPTPAPVYQAPLAPPPAPAYSTPLQTKKTNMTPILIGVGALFFICLCGATFWYIDSNYLWCNIFPFLTGCR